MLQGRLASLVQLQNNQNGRKKTNGIRFTVNTETQGKKEFFWGAPVLAILIVQLRQSQHSPSGYCCPHLLERTSNKLVPVSQQSTHQQEAAVFVTWAQSFHRY